MPAPEISRRTDGLRMPLPNPGSDVVGEILAYILSHKGPDEEGRASAKYKRPYLAQVELALAEARAAGLSSDLAPYHFRDVLGIYKHGPYLAEVIGKSIDYRVKKECGGSFGTFIKNVRSRMIKEPFPDVVGDRVLEIRPMSAFTEIGSNTFKAIRYYIEWRDKREPGFAARWTELRPYHLPMATRGFFQASDPTDIRNASEVVAKKIAQLLRDQWHGRLPNLIKEIAAKDIMSPFEEDIAGERFEVSAGAAFQVIGNTLFSAIRAYVDSQEGLAARYAELRPYHLERATRGYFSAQDDEGEVVPHREHCEEVMLRKVDRLLKESYGGSITLLMRKAQYEELIEPITDIIDGAEFTVSVSQAAEAFAGRHDILLRYLAHRRNIDPRFAEELEALGGGGAYDGGLFHLTGRAKNGTYSVTIADQTIWDRQAAGALLNRRIDSLLTQDCAGSMAKLVQLPLRDKLREPIVVRIGEEEFSVSTEQAFAAFGSSPYAVIRHYIDSRNALEPGFAERYQGLRPYHFYRTSGGTYSRNEGGVLEINLEMCSEVICKKIDYEVKNTFGGNFVALLTAVRLRDLATSFTEEISEELYEVSPRMAVEGLGSEVTKIFKHYASKRNLPFPYTPACFVGSTETRARRIAGQLSPYDLSLIRTSDGTYDTSLFGYRRFNSDDKELVRHLLFESVAVFLGSEPVAFLGLETENFDGIRVLVEHTDLAVDGSVAVERDPRVFNLMRMIKEDPRGKLHSALQGVSIYPGDIENVIGILEGPRFNVVFLDYLGHVTKRKLQTLEALFERSLLSDRAILAVTVATGGLHDFRAAKNAVRDQCGQVKQVIQKLAVLGGWHATPFDIHYRGGTTAKAGTPMALVGARLER